MVTTECPFSAEQIQFITDVCGCQARSITDIFPLTLGLTNISWHFRVKDNEYVLRLPGEGSELFIDRQAEMRALEVANDLGLDPTFLDGDAQRGWKISIYLAGSRTMNPRNPKEISDAMNRIRLLHDSGQHISKSLEFSKEGLRYLDIMDRRNFVFPPEFEAIADRYAKVNNLVSLQSQKRVLCHNDCFDRNFLVHGNEMLLIDWEYAGMAGYGQDLGTFVIASELTMEEAWLALEAYYSRVPTPEEKEHFLVHIAYSAWFWFCWSLLKECLGDKLSQSSFYYRYAIDFLPKAESILGL
ncbi:MAG: phosphotransferase [Actinomycetaceae bacterium]|nr:phosphotransferase [Actinomycetaceae bacterium]